MFQPTILPKQEAIILTSLSQYDYVELTRDVINATTEQIDGASKRSTTPPGAVDPSTELKA
jgi:hypothetical protein